MNPSSLLFSHTLKHIQQFMTILTKREPANGQGIAFWQDNWGVGILQFQFPTQHSFAISVHSMLTQMMDNADITDKFREDLSQQAQEELQQLSCLLVLSPITLTIGSNSAIWTWEASGQFIVRSAYYPLKNSLRIQNNRHII